MKLRNYFQHYTISVRYVGHIFTFRLMQVGVQGSILHWNAWQCNFTYYGAYFFIQCQLRRFSLDFLLSSSAWPWRDVFLKPFISWQYVTVRTTGDTELTALVNSSHSFALAGPVIPLVTLLKIIIIFGRWACKFSILMHVYLNTHRWHSSCLHRPFIHFFEVKSVCWIWGGVFVRDLHAKKVREI